MDLWRMKSNYSTLLGEFEEAVSTTQVLSGWLFAFAAKIW